MITTPVTDLPVPPAGFRTVTVQETGDRELDAIALCCVALRDLNPEERARAVGYLADRFEHIMVYAEGS
jgi:hypothetical protein